MTGLIATNVSPDSGSCTRRPSGFRDVLVINHRLTTNDRPANPVENITSDVTAVAASTEPTQPLSGI